MLKSYWLRMVEQVCAFPDGTAELDVKSVERAVACALITRTLIRLGYIRLSCLDKGIVR